MQAMDGGPLPENTVVCIGISRSRPATETQFLVENELRRKRAPEVVRCKIDAHRGGYEEPLGHEHLYQQGD